MATRLRVVRARLEDVRRVLRLEEGLLRHRARECWLTMLDGAREPCVVLGLGSKLGELVREDEARAGRDARATVHGGWNRGVR